MPLPSYLSTYWRLFLKILRSWQGKALWLGIFWGLLYSLLFLNIPLVQKLELHLQGALGRSRKVLPESSRLSKLPSQKILLIKINEKDLANQKLSLGRVFYASLVDHILKAGASVVILNLRSEWRETPDLDYPSDLSGQINYPLRELTKNYANKIIFVSVINRHNSKQSKIQIYNHFLPFNSDSNNPLVSPNYIQGFFEYDTESQNPTSLTSSARHAYLNLDLNISEQLDQKQSFKSVSLLALEKFALQEGESFVSQSLIDSKTPIQIDFLGKTGTFSSLSLTSICEPDKGNKCVLLPNSQLRRQVLHKIVLIGFAEGNNSHTLPMRSPFGDDMPAVEVQANQIASLMTGFFYQTPSEFLQIVLFITGAVFLNALLFLRINPASKWTHRYYLFLMIGLFSGYLLACLLLLNYQWMFPIVLPLSVWTATFVSMLISLTLEKQQDLIVQQTYEITKLKVAEQKAILSRTRKILHRLACEIHDGPLQELKLVRAC